MYPSHWHIPTQKEAVCVSLDQLYMFTNANTPPWRLKAMSMSLFKCKRLSTMVLRLQPVDQARFVDRADRVRPGLVLPYP